MNNVDLSYYERLQDAIDEAGHNRAPVKKEPAKMRKEDAQERHNKKGKPRQEKPDWNDLSEV